MADRVHPIMDNPPSFKFASEEKAGLHHASSSASSSNEGSSGCKSSSGHGGKGQQKQMVVYKGPRDVIYKQPAGADLPLSANRKQRPKRRRGCLCTCLVWILWIFILALVLLVTAALLFYFLANPRFPAFSVDSATVSQLELVASPEYSTALNSALAVTLHVENPNKKITFHYDDLDTSLAYPTNPNNNDAVVVIGKGSFVGINGTTLSQAPKSVDQIGLVFRGSNVIVGESTRKGLSDALIGAQNLSLIATTKARISIELAGCTSPSLTIRVSCHLIMGLINSPPSPPPPSSDQGFHMLSSSCSLKMQT